MLERGFSTQALFDTKNQELLKEDKYLFIKNLEVYYTDDRIIDEFSLINIYGDWGLGIGDWGLGIGDWAQSQSPIPNPQSPIPI